MAIVVTRKEGSSSYASESNKTPGLSMNMTPLYQSNIPNAWILCIPFLAPAFFIGVLRKDVAKRMADMTGYDARERFFTIMASLAPYPLLFFTIWTHFTQFRPLLYAGLFLYFAGIAAFYATIHTFAVTPPGKLLSTGLYGLSRNPLYVSASFVFLGICTATANLSLFGCLVILLVFQHVMILAEERICRQLYVATYENYCENVPRYLFFSYSGQQKKKG